MKRKLDNGPLKRIICNASWVVLERAIRLGIGFLIGVWVARYLGPAQYGILSFGIAWVALFSTLGKLGLEGIVVRDVVSERESEAEILGTAGSLRILGGFAVVICSTAFYCAFYGFEDDLQLAIVVLVALAQVFLAAEVIDWWFRSRVEWRYAFRARVFAFAASTAAKIAILVAELGVVWLAAATLLDAVLVAAFLVVELLRHGSRGARWTVRVGRAKKLLYDSWPAILSGLAIMVYMRIDQIMIGSMMTEADVGIYSVAVKLSEVWYVIPMAVVQSVMPSIVSARKRQDGSFEQRLIWLIAWLFWGSVLVAVVITLVAPWVVATLFGPEYEDAGRVLQVHFWAGVFVAMGVSIGQWFLAENKLKNPLYRTITGILANVLMNIILIPRLGVLGAAIATVVSQFVQVYLSTGWLRQSKPAWRLLNRGIVYPLLRLSGSRA